MKDILKKSKRIIFNKLDIFENRKVENNVMTNKLLLEEVMKYHKEKFEYRSKRFWYQKYDGNFIFDTNSQKWYFIQCGYIDYNKDKFVINLLYHDSNFSSGFGNIEFLKEKHGFDFDTLTKEMPDEFKNSKEYPEDVWKRINDPLLRYSSLRMIKLNQYTPREYTYLERYIEVYPLWSKDEMPEYIQEEGYYDEIYLDMETYEPILTRKKKYKEYPKERA